MTIYPIALSIMFLVGTLLGMFIMKIAQKQKEQKEKKKQ